MVFGILGTPSPIVVPSSDVLAPNGPVIEDKHSSHVPGTALLSELSVRHGRTAVINTVAHKLKRGAGRDSHVVLNPQPSDDPRDPYVLSPDSSLTAKLTTL